ncbi:hypothetical protein HR060_11545 [Catenovulum sp. SM1970]|uniref:hypothetical protein n=1 Tax=Marinifaba aquimaris TaxID=2741323 RepID=UPI001572247C|nr:hypothetical protein [Marinifaba aquimaris]NTS77496.1 hypothetical protein [Marinifaba aquimaris]
MSNDIALNGNSARLNIPSIEEQRMFLMQQGTKEAIEQLEQNLSVPFYGLFNAAIEKYPKEHLLDSGYKTPDHELVYELFEIVKTKTGFSDKDLATEIFGFNSDRMIRYYKTGQRNIKQALWHRFLIMTGFKKQRVLKVIGYF